MNAQTDIHPALRPVYQTIWGQAGLAGWENCKEASVATLLGLDLDDVAPFNAFDRRGNYDAFQTHVNMTRWFRTRGLALIQLHGGLIPDCYYLAQGPCSAQPEGGDYLAHMVVMRAGRLAHDPIRRGRGLYRIDSIIIVVPQVISESRPGGWHSPASYVPRFEPEPLPEPDHQPMALVSQATSYTDDSVWTQDWEPLPTF